MWRKLGEESRFIECIDRIQSALTSDLRGDGFRFLYEEMITNHADGCCIQLSLDWRREGKPDMHLQVINDEGQFYFELQGNELAKQLSSWKTIQDIIDSCGMTMPVDKRSNR